MRSNWTPWDLVKARPQVLDSNQQGIVAIHSFDPYIEKIFLKRIPQKGQLIPVLGSELTLEWIDRNLSTMDLFGAGESYLVMCAEDLPNGTKELLLQNQLVIDGRLIVFLFSKSGVFFDKWSKNGQGEFIKIEAPKFWDSRKLLDFLARELSVNLPYDLSSMLLETLNTDDSSELYHFLEMLKVYSEIDVPPSCTMAQDLLGNKKLDQFRLSSLFCQKRWEQFWPPLAEEEYTFDQLRSLFFFMSSHLFKVYDPSYAQGKGKLSKYDQEILAYSKKWDRKELLRYIRLFSQLEQRCKARDEGVIQDIRLAYLSSQR